MVYPGQMPAGMPMSAAQMASVSTKAGEAPEWGAPKGYVDPNAPHAEPKERQTRAARIFKSLTGQGKSATPMAPPSGSSQQPSSRDRPAPPPPREIRAETRVQPSVEEMRRRSAVELENFKQNFMTERQLTQLKAQEDWFAQKNQQAPASQPRPGSALPMAGPPSAYPEYQQPSAYPEYQQPQSQLRASSALPMANPNEELVEVSKLDGSVQVMPRHMAEKLVASSYSTSNGDATVSGGSMLIPQSGTQMHQKARPTGGSAIPMTQPRAGSALPMTQSLYSSHDPYSLPQYQPQAQSIYTSQSFYNHTPQDQYAAQEQQKNYENDLQLLAQQNNQSLYDGSDLYSQDPYSRQQEVYAQPDYPQPQTLYASHDPYSLPQYQPQQQAPQQTIYASRDPFNFSDVANSLPYQPYQPDAQQPVAPSDWEASGPYERPPGTVSQPKGRFTYPEAAPPQNYTTTSYMTPAAPMSGSALVMMPPSSQHMQQPQSHNLAEQISQAMGQRGSSALPMSQPQTQTGSALPMAPPGVQYSSVQYVNVQKVPVQQTRYTPQDPYSQPQYVTMTQPQPQQPQHQFAPQQHQYAPQPSVQRQFMAQPQFAPQQFVPQQQQQFAPQPQRPMAMSAAPMQAPMGYMNAPMQSMQVQYVPQQQMPQQQMPQQWLNDGVEM